MDVLLKVDVPNAPEGREVASQRSVTVVLCNGEVDSCGVESESTALCAAVIPLERLMRSDIWISVLSLAVSFAACFDRVAHWCVRSSSGKLLVTMRAPLSRVLESRLARKISLTDSVVDDLKELELVSLSDEDEEGWEYFRRESEAVVEEDEMFSFAEPAVYVLCAVGQSRISRGLIL